MLIVSSIRLVFDLSVFRVPRPCLYMLGSSSQPKCFACVPRPCLYMLGSSTPVVCERKNLSHPIITWCFETTNLHNGAQLGGTLLLKFYKGSSYLLPSFSANKMHNMINITCNQIVTWYGQYHFAPFDLHLRGSMIIIVTGMTPWSPSSWSPSSCLHEVVTPTTTSTSMANAFSNKVK